MGSQDVQPRMQSEIIGSGSPIVLVPGGLTGWISWIPHAEQLSQGRTVVRVQLLAVELGLNAEPIPPEYSVDYETDALRRTLDEVGVVEADFAAWSYGAEITLNFALNHPERVRTLTLIEPPAIWVLRSRAPLSTELLKEQQQIKTLAVEDVSDEQLVWFSHFAGFVPPNVDPRTLPQWPVWMKHRQSLRTGDVVFRHQDDIQRVRAFNKPVLLFKGEGSTEFLHQIIDILGEEFPNVRVKERPGGHAPHIASMQPFMEILNAFLDHPFQN